MSEKATFNERFASVSQHVRSAVSEMLGRTEPQKTLAGGKIKATFGQYQEVSTYDISRTSYGLARAIYFGNLYSDRKTSKEYGKEYLLGAPFGKPIINIAAGFAVGSPIRIVESHTVTDEDDPAVNPVTKRDTEQTPDPLDTKSGDSPTKPKTGIADIQDTDAIEPVEIPPITVNPTIANVNQWLDENHHFIFTGVRNKLRDGDTFIVMEDNGEMTEIPPEDVDIITNPDNPDLIEGYDVFSTFTDPTDPSATKLVTYVDEIRLTYRRRCKVADDVTKERTEVPGTLVDYRNEFDGGLEERILPVVHFANEKEPRALYGVSEYQNLYYLIANYHAVLSAAIKSNIYNSTSVPVIHGIKNVGQFLKQNFDQDKDGNYVLKWNKEKMLVVGEGGDVKFLQADGTAADAQTLLEILFYLICQASETPEFAFGTAVSSSKASVSEQTPMLVKKAIRQQGQLQEPIRKLIQLYIERMAKLRPQEFDLDTQFSIDMPDILDEDLNINIQIVNALLEKGIITEETAMTMLNLGKYVKNFQEELARAKAQKDARNPIPTDAFGQPLTNDDEEDTSDRISKEAAVEEMLNDPRTRAVGEMLAKNINSLTLSQIQEMNPYHDNEGKFADAPGGGSKGANPKANEVTIGNWEDHISMGALSKAQQDEVNNYMDFGFSHTNDALRKHKGNLSKIGYSDSYQPGIIKTIDGAMLGKLKTDATLYRGLSLKGDIDVGATILDHGFSSTTFNRKKAIDFSDIGKGDTRYVLNIKAPKGLKGIFGPAVSKSDLAREEMEYILPRKTKLYITKKTKKRTRDDILGADFFELEAEIR